MTDIDATIRAGKPTSIADSDDVELALAALVDAAIDGAPRRRRNHLGVLVGLTACALTFGAGAAATADSLWTNLLGAPPDAHVAVIVAKPGQAGQVCQIGVLVQPASGVATSNPDVLAARRFLATHDWSHLRPDLSQLKFTPEFAAAHKIDLRPLIAGTVANQITDALKHGGLLTTKVELKGVVDCGIGVAK